VFFDFRGLHGDEALAQQLRTDVTARAQQSPRFLKLMADNALRNRAPATGWFDELLRGDDAPVDLKMQGTVPFVDAARIWALGAGRTATGTVDRLRQLAAQDRLPREDVDAWTDAFQFLQLMRLRRQHRLMAEGGGDGLAPNTVRPRDLSPLDRRILREAFRQARKLQARLELDFPG
jgi:CBS domain-containing protein